MAVQISVHRRLEFCIQHIAFKLFLKDAICFYPTLLKLELSFAAEDKTQLLDKVNLYGAVKFVLK